MNQRALPERARISVRGPVEGPVEPQVEFYSLSGNINVWRSVAVVSVFTAVLLFTLTFTDVIKGLSDVYWAIFGIGYGSAFLALTGATIRYAIVYWLLSDNERVQRARAALQNIQRENLVVSYDTLDPTLFDVDMIQRDIAKFRKLGYSLTIYDGQYHSLGYRDKLRKVVGKSFILYVKQTNHDLENYRLRVHAFVGAHEVGRVYSIPGAVLHYIGAIVWNFWNMFFVVREWLTPRPWVITAENLWTTQAERDIEIENIGVILRRYRERTGGYARIIYTGANPLPSSALQGRSFNPRVNEVILGLFAGLWIAGGIILGVDLSGHASYGEWVGVAATFAWLFFMVMGSAKVGQHTGFTFTHDSRNNEHADEAGRILDMHYPAGAELNEELVNNLNPFLFNIELLRKDLVRFSKKEGYRFVLHTEKGLPPHAMGSTDSRAKEVRLSFMLYLNNNDVRAHDYVVFYEMERIFFGGYLPNWFESFLSFTGLYFYALFVRPVVFYVRKLSQYFRVPTSDNAESDRILAAAPNDGTSNVIPPAPELPSEQQYNPSTNRRVAYFAGVVTLITTAILLSMTFTGNAEAGEFWTIFGLGYGSAFLALPGSIVRHYQTKNLLKSRTLDVVTRAQNVVDVIAGGVGIDQLHVVSPGMFDVPLMQEDMDLAAEHGYTLVIRSESQMGRRSRSLEYTDRANKLVVMSYIMYVKRMDPNAEATRLMVHDFVSWHAEARYGSKFVSRLPGNFQTAFIHYVGSIRWFIVWFVGSTIMHVRQLFSKVRGYARVPDEPVIHSPEPQRLAVHGFVGLHSSVRAQPYSRHHNNFLRIVMAMLMVHTVILGIALPAANVIAESSAGWFVGIMFPILGVALYSFVGAHMREQAASFLDSQTFSDPHLRGAFYIINLLEDSDIKSHVRVLDPRIFDIPLIKEEIARVKKMGYTFKLVTESKLRSMTNDSTALEYTDLNGKVVAHLYHLYVRSPELTIAGGSSESNRRETQAYVSWHGLGRVRMYASSMFKWMSTEMHTVLLHIAGSLRGLVPHFAWRMRERKNRLSNPVNNDEAKSLLVSVPEEDKKSEVAEPIVVNLVPTDLQVQASRSNDRAYAPVSSDYRQGSDDAMFVVNGDFIDVMIPNFHGLGSERVLRLYYEGTNWTVSAPSENLSDFLKKFGNSFKVIDHPEMGYMVVGNMLAEVASRRSPPLQSELRRRTILNYQEALRAAIPAPVQSGDMSHDEKVHSPAGSGRAFLSRVLAWWLAVPSMIEELGTWLFAKLLGLSPRGFSIHPENPYVNVVTETNANSGRMFVLTLSWPMIWIGLAAVNIWGATQLFAQSAPVWQIVLSVVPLAWTVPMAILHLRGFSAPATKGGPLQDTTRARLILAYWLGFGRTVVQDSNLHAPMRSAMGTVVSPEEKSEPAQAALKPQPPLDGSLSEPIYRQMVSRSQPILDKLKAGDEKALTDAAIDLANAIPAHPGQFTPISYKPLDSFKSFQESAEYYQYLHKAKRLYLDGKAMKIVLAGGSATRFGLGSMYAHPFVRTAGIVTGDKDIWQSANADEKKQYTDISEKYKKDLEEYLVKSYLPRAEKELGRKLSDSEKSGRMDTERARKLNLLKRLFTALKEKGGPALHRTLGELEMMQYRAQIEKLKAAELVEQGMSVERAREEAAQTIFDVPMVIVVNSGNWEDVKRDFARDRGSNGHRFYGFNPDRIYFIKQVLSNGYEFKDGTWQYEPTGLLPLANGHGEITRLMAQKETAIRLKAAGNGSVQETVLEPGIFGAEMGNTDFLNYSRLNDLTKLGHTSLDLEALGFAIWSKEKGFNFAVRMVKNVTGQKGGNAVHDTLTDKDILIETMNSNGSPELDKVVKLSVETYNVFDIWADMDAVAGVMLNGQGLPANLRQKNGRLYVEFVTGDITRAEKAKTVFFQEPMTLVTSDNDRYPRLPDEMGFSNEDGLAIQDVKTMADLDTLLKFVLAQQFDSWFVSVADRYSIEESAQSMLVSVEKFLRLLDYRVISGLSSMAEYLSSALADKMRSLRDALKEPHKYFSRIPSLAWDIVVTFSHMPHDVMSQSVIDRLDRLNQSDPISELLAVVQSALEEQMDSAMLSVVGQSLKTERAHEIEARLKNFQRMSPEEKKQFHAQMMKAGASIAARPGFLEMLSLSYDLRGRSLRPGEKAATDAVITPEFVYFFTAAQAEDLLKSYPDNEKITVAVTGDQRSSTPELMAMQIYVLSLYGIEAVYDPNVDPTPIGVVTRMAEWEDKSASPSHRPFHAHNIFTASHIPGTGPTPQNGIKSSIRRVALFSLKDFGDTIFLKRDLARQSEVLNDLKIESIELNDLPNDKLVEKINRALELRMPSLYTLKDSVKTKLPSEISVLLEQVLDPTQEMTLPQLARLNKFLFKVRVLNHAMPMYSSEPEYLHSADGAQLAESLKRALHRYNAMDAQRVSQSIPQGFVPPTQEDFLSEYKKYLKQSFKLYADEFKTSFADKKPILIVDTANGVMGPVAADVLDDLKREHGFEYIILRGGPVSYHPVEQDEKSLDPSQWNTYVRDVVPDAQKALEQIQNYKQYMGLLLTFDGDADRLGVGIVMNGVVHYATGQSDMLLFTRLMKQRYPHAQIPLDFRSGMETIRAVYGDSPLTQTLWARTGSSNFRRKIFETDAEGAIEYSGHAFKRIRPGLPSGVSAIDNPFDVGLWYLAALFSSSDKIKSLVQDALTQPMLPSMDESRPVIDRSIANDPARRKDLMDMERAQVKHEIQARYPAVMIEEVLIDSEKEPGAARIQAWMGPRLIGWFTVRASNTSPKLSNTVEPGSEKDGIALAEILIDVYTNPLNPGYRGKIDIDGKEVASLRKQIASFKEKIGAVEPAHAVRPDHEYRAQDSVYNSYVRVPHHDEAVKVSFYPGGIGIQAVVETENRPLNLYIQQGYALQPFELRRGQNIADVLSKFNGRFEQKDDVRLGLIVVAYPRGPGGTMSLKEAGQLARVANYVDIQKQKSAEFKTAFQILTKAQSKELRREKTDKRLTELLAVYQGLVSGDKRKAQYAAEKFKQLLSNDLVDISVVPVQTNLTDQFDMNRVQTESAPDYGLAYRLSPSLSASEKTELSQAIKTYWLEGVAQARYAAQWSDNQPQMSRNEPASQDDVYVVNGLMNALNSDSVASRRLVLQVLDRLAQQPDEPIVLVFNSGTKNEVWNALSAWVQRVAPDKMNLVKISRFRFEPADHTRKINADEVAQELVRKQWVKGSPRFVTDRLDYFELSVNSAVQIKILIGSLQERTINGLDLFRLDPKVIQLMLEQA